MIEDKDLYIQKLEKKIKKLKKKNKKLSKDLLNYVLADMEEIKENHEKILNSSRENLQEALKNGILKIKQFNEKYLNKYDEEDKSSDYILKVQLPVFKSEEENKEIIKSMIGEVRLINKTNFNSEGEENGNQ
jgi:uncharacterized membrane protein YgaE (UPF0421/DUF939 family)